MADNAAVEGGDPHAAKLPPNDPSLTIERKRGRTLKQGPVVLVVGAVLFLMLMALFIGLNPDRTGAIQVEDEVAVSQAPIVPDFIRLNEGNAAPVPLRTPDYVPPLGNPLPGDLADALVAPAKKPPPQSNNRDVRAPISAIPLDSGPSPEELERMREEKLARNSGIFFNSTSLASLGDSLGGAGDDLRSQLLSRYEQTLGQGQGGLPDSSLAGLIGGEGDAFPPGDQNSQERKNSFLDGAGSKDNGYLEAGLVQPVSPYEVKAGAVIPVSLITGINSDLPGEIIGQVRENVYDTVTGNHLLIPQGSRLMATYDSVIAYGQERVLVCWNRIIRPDGSSMALECMPGTDLEGYAGVADRVDNHWWRIAGGVLLSSVLATGTTVSRGDDLGGNDATVDQVIAANIGGNINDVGQQITEKNLNIQPTIKIRPGYSVNVMVNRDMVLPPYVNTSNVVKMRRQ